MDNMRNILFFFFLIFMMVSFTISANEADINKAASESYYHSVNQNTILILKEKTNYFKKRPVNSFFVGNLKWSSDLETKIKKDLSFYQVVSKEINETVSSKALKTISKLIDSNKPKVVVVSLGENDGLFSKTVKEIRQYLAAIIKTAQNSNAKVILVGNSLPLHYGLEYSNNFVKMYAELAEQFDIAYVPEDKISYTYPLFFYSYNPFPVQDPLQSTLQVKRKSSEKIWNEVDKIITQEKQNNAKLPEFYRYPEFLLGAYHR
jgi:hypothetical protein